MGDYIVSARKYRPQTFDSVVGQSSLTTTLKNAISSGRLAHAYLFCGPRGVGKTTCARIFAKTINCMHPRENGDACDECESCKAFNDQRSLNIQELDAASNNGIEDIRSLIDQTRVPPQVGKYKVFIIDEVHMLSQQAFNAFLKTLEEPPAYVIFILATTEKQKVLPTILSRCQIFDFNPMDVEETIKHLEYVAKNENIEYEPEALNIIAQKANGGMRDALSIFDQVVSFTQGKITYKQTLADLNVLDYEYYFKLTDAFLASKVPDALLILNTVLNRGFDALHFMEGLGNHLRDLLVSKDDATLPLLKVGESLRARYKEQAAKCSPKFLFGALKLCNTCQLNYRSSNNKRFLVEVTLIELAQLTQPDSDEASRRKPAKTLKPIFNKSADVKPQGDQTKAAEPHATNAAPTISVSVPEKKVKIPTISSIPGISLKHPVQEKPAETVNEQSVSSNIDTEDCPVTERDVNMYWREYAKSLPQKDSALSGRMLAMQVKQIEGKACDFSVTVNNIIVQKDMKDVMPSILKFLKRKVSNSQLTIAVDIIKDDDTHQAFTRPEKFARMAKKNPALEQLKDAFGLDFS